MKLLSINLSATGSTGNIMKHIHNISTSKGFLSKMAVPSKLNLQHDENYYMLGTFQGRKLSVYASIITGLEGFFSIISTYKFLHKISKYQPDVIHLHNLHQSYINLPMLFKFIKKNNIKVVWTLHDCWSFTGHCPHFSYEKCDLWKRGCHHCPRYKMYPKSLFDNSRFMWRLKKKWFTNIQNMTIVTPSVWLSKQVQESFMKNYPVKVIYNGIDLSAFKPTNSNFKAQYHLIDKKIILGVAYDWGDRKGLDVFIELTERLDQTYHIVLVGTNDAVDLKLPNIITSIHKTNDQNMLSEIYSSADIFVNPTREDNFPTVNIEALACGTPVITFNTGGSPECIDDTCGIVVEKDDIDSLIENIEYVCTKKPFTREACLKRASKFDYKNILIKYMDIYEVNKGR